MPGAFIVNIGDMCQLWTNGLFQSTVHRVVSSAGVERMSMPFFFEPNFECLVECLPSCCGEGNPARFAPVTAGECASSQPAADEKSVHSLPKISWAATRRRMPSSRIICERRRVA